MTSDSKNEAPIIDESITIMVLGAQKVGKSCFLTRCIANNFTDFYDPTFHQGFLISILFKERVELTFCSR